MKLLAIIEKLNSFFASWWPFAAMFATIGAVRYFWVGEWGHGVALLVAAFGFDVVLLCRRFDMVLDRSMNRWAVQYRLHDAGIELAVVDGPPEDISAQLADIHPDISPEDISIVQMVRV